MRRLLFRSWVKELQPPTAEPHGGPGFLPDGKGNQRFRRPRSLGVPGCWQVAEGAWELSVKSKPLPHLRRPVWVTPAAGLVASRGSLGVGRVWNSLIGRKQTAGHFVK